MSRLAMLVVSLWVGSTPSVGLAAPPRTPVPAQQKRIDGLLLEASDLIRKERLPEALDKVEAAQAIAETAEVLNFRGRVLYLMKRDDASRAAYEAALAAPGPIDPAVRAAIDEGLAKVDRRSRGTLELDVTPVDATLEVDGVARAPGPDGRLELARGPHRIKLSQAGHVAHEQDVEVPGGDVVRVVVVLGREREVIKTVEVPGEEPVDFGPWPWVSLGLGAVAAGVGAWLVVDGTEDWNAVDSDMPKAEAEALVDSGTDKRTGGFVALGVGGAAIVTGVLMLLLETDGGPAESTGAAIGIAPLNGGVGAFLGGAF